MDRKQKVVCDRLECCCNVSEKLSEICEKGGVAVCLRSLRIRAAEEKNIPRPSKELMSSK